MDLVTHSIPNLFNGISQQTPSVRQDNQGAEQINGYSSIVEGLGKRHPLNYVASLDTNGSHTNFYHFIHRDDVEKYVVRISTLGGSPSISVWGIDGTPRTVTTPNGTGYLNCASPKDNLVAITIADYTFIVNKTVVVQMLAGSNASYTSSETLQKFQDITYTPPSGPAKALVAGRLYSVVGDNTNGFGKYYVTPNAGLTAVTECVVDTILNSFDPATMPYVLIRNSDGTFTFKQNTWGSRLVGDAISAAQPSFVGNTINYIVLYRNRLGFLSGENVVFSRAGDYFNFWPKTAIQVLDGDPIDVAVSNNKVSTLRYAVAFNKNLVIFSQFAQFMFSTATDLLTPKTVVINQTTEYSASPSCVPVVAGSNVYFDVPGATSSWIREYFVQPYQLSYAASDITAHVPSYLPKNLNKLVASSNGDVLFAMTGVDPTTADYTNWLKIYVYKFYWSGDTKAQSSWSHWLFNYIMYSMCLMDTRLYVLYLVNAVLTLGYIDLQPSLDDGLGYTIYLDNKTQITGTYDAGTGLTTWVTPYVFTDAHKLVLGSGFTTGAGDVIDINSGAGTNTITAVGDYSAHPVYIGVPYTFSYTFSPQYVKDREKLPMTQANFKLRNFNLLYTKSLNFTASVTPLNRATYSYSFTGKSLGTTSTTLGTAKPSNGVFKFPIQSAGDTVNITITNSSPYPSFFQGAEWEGFVSFRAARI